MIHPSLIDEPTINVEKFRLQKTQKNNKYCKNSTQALAKILSEQQNNSQRRFYAARRILVGVHSPK